MKKIFLIIVVVVSLLPTVVYAEDVAQGNCSEVTTELTYDEFSFAVMREFPFIDYVAHSVYVEWKGNAEVFIQWLKDNPTDLGTEDDVQTVMEIDPEEPMLEGCETNDIK